MVQNDLNTKIQTLWRGTTHPITEKSSQRSVGSSVDEKILRDDAGKREGDGLTQIPTFESTSLLLLAFLLDPFGKNEIYKSKPPTEHIRRDGWE